MPEEPHPIRGLAARLWPLGADALLRAVKDSTRLGSRRLTSLYLVPEFQGCRQASAAHKGQQRFILYEVYTEYSRPPSGEAQCPVPVAPADLITASNQIPSGEAALATD